MSTLDLVSATRWQLLLIAGCDQAALWQAAVHNMVSAYQFHICWINMSWQRSGLTVSGVVVSAVAELMPICRKQQCRLAWWSSVLEATLAELLSNLFMWMRGKPGKQCPAMKQVGHCWSAQTATLLGAAARYPWAAEPRCSTVLTCSSNELWPERWPCLVDGSHDDGLSC